MHLIRPERTIEIPLKFGIGGTVTIRRRDMRTGELDLVRESKPNMILDKWVKEYLTINRTGGFRPFLSSSSGSAVTNSHAISSSTTAITTSTTSLTDVLASTETITRGSLIWDGDHKIKRSFSSAFPAGVGTGTVNTVAVRDNWNTYVAMQSVSPGIEKGEYHQLEVEWTFSLGRSPSWDGTIVNGQVSGDVDISWVATVRDSDLVRIGTNPSATIPQVLGDNRYIAVGDSNAATNMEGDGYTLEGSSLFAGKPPLFTADEYVDHTWERTWRVGFDIQHANGDIGEVIYGYVWSSIDRPIFRMTFNPKLAKADNYRLFLDFKFSYEDVNAT